MFLDQDILLRNGSLAVVWTAGTEVNQIHDKRSKEYKLAINSSILRICADLRALFPRMGTAYGLNLTKMGILAKGAGAIYVLKVKSLALDILRATQKKPIVLKDAQITLPAQQKGSKSKGKTGKSNAVNIEFPDPNQTMFGEHAEAFELVREGYASPRALPSNQLEGEYPPGPIPLYVMVQTPTPPEVEDAERAPGSRRKQRSSAKRRRDEDSEEAMYRDVIEKLHIANANQQAHLLPESDTSLMARQVELDFAGEMDFGDGMALLLANNEDPPVRDQQVCAVGEEDLMIPPPATSVSAPSAISGLGGQTIPESFEMEVQHRLLATPPSGTSHSGNEGMPQNDMALEEIGEDRRRPLPQPSRIRFRLKIDQETNMSLREILCHIRETNAETNSEYLFDQLRKTQAPPKSQWKTLGKAGNVLDFITSSGRPGSGRVLTEMRKGIMERLKRRPERTELRGISMEEERDQTHSTTAGVSSRSNVLAEQTIGRGQTIQAPELELEPAPFPPHQADQVTFAPAPEMMELEHPVQFDMGEGLGQQQVMEQLVPPSVSDSQVPPPSRKRSRVRDLFPEDEPEPGLSKRLEGGNTFSSLYPPEKVTRRRAAMAFYTLLKMQAKREVMLKQEEPYGDILIERISSIRGSLEASQ